ncbi:MAG: DNA translocase FtsK 4TM domain-containing protein [Methylococcaceae bacterium]
MSAVMDEKTSKGLKEAVLLFFGALALFLLISLLTFNLEDAGWTHNGSGAKIINAGGIIGAWFADLLLSMFGVMAVLFPVMIAWQGYLLYAGEKDAKNSWSLTIRWLGFVVSLMSGTALAYLHFSASLWDLPGSMGGILGQELGDKLLLMLGGTGASLLLLAALFAGATLATGVSWVSLVDRVGYYTLMGLSYLFEKGVALNAYYQEKKSQKQNINSSKPPRKRQRRAVDKVKIEPVIPPVFEQSMVIKAQPKSKRKNPVPSKLLDVPQGSLPPLELLEERHSIVKGYTSSEMEDMSRKVELILADFGVKVDVVAVLPGPVITRFELNPAPGVKVSRISTLAKDLARALSVTSVRIVEIIPGKSVIGMEIPNKEREMVSLQQILSSDVYERTSSPLTLALGKDIAGGPVVADLGKMPHLLVAGTTGSGKSVAINTMILSLLYKSTPDQVRMIMIDPKMLELSVYEGIPHLLTPVVIDMKEAANALCWCVAEMERRYKLMSKMGVRNLAGFNALITEAEKNGEPIRDPLFILDRELEEGEEFPVLTTLPSIVIVIDELADMMMIVGKKVEELIARLAQKARAAGLHLILATQRPSVDVLTGLIKANVPTRISFQVSSKIDSRTILDQGGAEALLGNGDMLFLPSGTSIPTRAHGAFVDDHEVHKVVNFLKKTGTTNYLKEITQGATGDEIGLDGLDFVTSSDSENDPLYDQAVRFVTDKRKASISSVQRQFKVGYNRAARMIEDMEMAGIVSSAEGNGSRQVIAPPPPVE